MRVAMLQNNPAARIHNVGGVKARLRFGNEPRLRRHPDNGTIHAPAGQWRRYLKNKSLNRQDARTQSIDTNIAD
jgi:hypothetical protein